MREKINFEQVAGEALARSQDLVRELLPHGVREGQEWVCGNLAGDKGDSCKVNLQTGRWKDFATDEAGGDLIGLVKACKGFENMLDAARWLQGEIVDSGNSYKPNPIQREAKVDNWQPIFPVPQDKLMDFESLKHYRLGKPSRYWIYRDTNNNVNNVCCRFDKPDGGKDVVPYTYGTMGSKEAKWYWKQIPDNRPLYGLERLEIKGAVLLVEGEKAADAAFTMLDGKVPVLTWAGGGKAIKKADFSPIAGRPVIIIADGDKAGHDTTKALADMLAPIAKTIRYVLTDEVEGITGWDAADAQDAGWTGGQFFKWISQNAVRHGEEPKKEEESPPAHHNDSPPPHTEEDIRENINNYPAQYESEVYDPEIFKDQKIRALGYNHGTFYYYSSRGRQVVALAPNQHNSGFLGQLADLSYWESQFPGKGKSTMVDWTEAAYHCMGLCYSRGVYNPAKIRGRGGWNDDDRKVQHAGDMLFVDGKPTRLTDFKSRYIYEEAPAIEFDETLPPLTAKECQDVMSLCKSARWEHELMAYYFAGWCVVAPFCGMLSWRPHLWVTGSAGSGKSWMLEQVAHTLLGKWPLFVQFESTEAGLRQTLRNDALPVIFDEAKGEDKGETDKIQRVIGLMRQASSDNNASILKGTTGGKAMEFQIRSCFLLSSIGLGIKQHADETRISVLSIKTAPLDEVEQKAEEIKFAKMEEVRLKLTPEFVQRLHNRTLRLMPIIRENAKTFALAAARVLGTKRAGDQAGILLSGCYSLFSTKLISLEDAIAWVKKHHIANTITASDPDYARCFNYLIQTSIRVHNTKNIAIEVPIGELVDVCRRTYDVEGAEILNETAKKALSRRGLKVIKDGKYLAVANNHIALADIFKNTAWSSNWGRSLKQNPTTKNNNNSPVYFGGQASSKVSTVLLPPMETQEINDAEDIPF